MSTKQHLDDSDHCHLVPTPARIEIEGCRHYWCAGFMVSPLIKTKNKQKQSITQQYNILNFQRTIHLTHEFSSDGWLK